MEFTLLSLLEVLVQIAALCSLLKVLHQIRSFRRYCYKLWKTWKMFWAGQKENKMLFHLHALSQMRKKFGRSWKTLGEMRKIGKRQVLPDSVARWQWLVYRKVRARESYEMGQSLADVKKTKVWR